MNSLSQFLRQARILPSNNKTRQAPANSNLLAIGYWLLAIGYWLLAIGYWLLAIG